MIDLLIFFSVLNAAHAQTQGSCDPSFGIVETPRIITIMPNQTATVHCQYECTGVDWNSCGIQANAIVIIPADDYSAYGVCITEDIIQFNQQGYNITASCNSNSTCTSQHNVQMATYAVTLMGFNESSFHEFVIVCAAARRTPGSLLEPIRQYSGILQERSIIKVMAEPNEPVKIFGEDVDRYPVKTAQEGDDVSIICSKTPGTISEWKLSILKQSNALEVLYINSINATKVTNNLHLEEGSINQVGLQTFSITVDVNMTGTAIQCGARRNRMSSSRTLYYHQAAILIVKEKRLISECPTCRSRYKYCQSECCTSGWHFFWCGSTTGCSSGVSIATRISFNTPGNTCTSGTQSRTRRIMQVA